MDFIEFDLECMLSTLVATVKSVSCDVSEYPLNLELVTDRIVPVVSFLPSGVSMQYTEKREHIVRIMIW